MLQIFQTGKNFRIGERILIFKDECGTKVKIIHACSNMNGLLKVFTILSVEIIHRDMKSTYYR